MVHLEVRLRRTNDNRYTLERAEDGRALTLQRTGEVRIFETEFDAYKYADMMGHLITNGKTYAEAYRDRYLPGVPIYDELPEGWRVTKNSLTQPRGTVWINNGQSLFGGKYKHALMYV